MVLATACGTHQPPAATPASLGRDTTVSRLQHDIHALLGNQSLERGWWGIEVRSLERSDVLYSANAQKLFVPASNMKILTLAAAARRLGWNYRYETKLIAGGTIEDGVLNGDLIVQGSGDPTIEDWDAASTNVFQLWTARLRERGIRAINGRIVGDDDAVEDEGLGPGWAWDDLDRSYATASGALQFNQNSAQLTIAAGTAAGQPAIATLKPDESGLEVHNLVITGTADSAASIITRRLSGRSDLEVRGSVPLASASIVRPVSVPNSTMYFVTSLRRALLRAGIEVRGSPVDIDDISAPAHVDSPLFIHQSEPISVLAVTMMKTSQNLYAETLLRTLGTRDGVATSQAGRDVETDVLQEWIGASDLVIADGSGLSRYNLVTPGALVATLQSLYKDEALRDPFLDSLPIAGRDGTLATRMRGTRAEGNARAKTGSLSNARALSGYLRTADGEPLAFSMLANNFGVSADIIDRTMDAIVVKLAEFTRGR